MGTCGQFGDLVAPRDQGRQGARLKSTDRSIAAGSGDERLYIIIETKHTLTRWRGSLECDAKRHG